MFYWVSEYKPRYYQYEIIAAYAHLLQVSRWWWYAKFVCYRYCIEITLSISFLRISVDIDFLVSISVDMFLAFVILNIAVFIWNSDSHAWDLLIAVYLINNLLDKT